MSALIPLSLQDTASNVKAYLVSKAGEWSGRIVTKIKSSMIYLEDPRVASATIFLVNFGILELAIRVSQVLTLCLPRRTVVQKKIKSGFEMILAGGLTIGGNITLIRMTGISIHPFSVVAIVAVVCIARHNLKNYLEY